MHADLHADNMKTSHSDALVLLALVLPCPRPGNYYYIHHTGTY